MNNLLVFTTGASDLLRQSCERVMITLTDFQAPWTGGCYVTAKLKAGVKFLQDRPEEYMMWVDGADSLVVKPADEILARLHAAGDPVIIAAERTCWPDSIRSVDYEERDNKVFTTQPRYLNAGGYIGHKQMLLTVMHTVIQCADNEDDQRAWTTAYLAGLLPDVQIDHSRRIFSCVGDGDEALRADTCAQHFNGRTPGMQEHYDMLYNLVEGTGFYKL